MFQDFFKIGVINAALNETYICLIPKRKEAKTVHDYRPISLIPCTYKILARVFSERLKKVLPLTISDQQYAFVEGRQILDSALIANEIIDDWQARKLEGVVIQLDLEKAFDMVDWDFLDMVLKHKGFGEKWRKWIRACISTTSFSIIINGKSSGKFTATRGLRQGDPLSPFLFIIITVVLSQLLHQGEQQGQLSGCESRCGLIKINHLFADDTLLFSNKDPFFVKKLHKIIKFFEVASGLSNNYNKSSVYGISIGTQIITRIANAWGCTTGSWPSTYLGLPLNGNPKKEIFWLPINEKLQIRLCKWNNLFISKGGRHTILQSILTNLPTYYLSLFKISAKVADRMDKIFGDFLWEGPNNNGKPHLINWNTTQLAIKEGGLGIGNIKQRNRALLSRWVWRYITEPKQLWRRLISAKYSRSPSTIWPTTYNLNHKGPGHGLRSHTKPT